MKKADLYNVLIHPLVTEKSTTVEEKHDQVVFKVQKYATRLDVKEAFELAFNAKVDKVSILNVKGKSKRFGRFYGSRASWKKAYIKLSPGQNFDLASNQK